MKSTWISGTQLFNENGTKPLKSYIPSWIKNSFSVTEIMAVKVFLDKGLFLFLIAHILIITSASVDGEEISVSGGHTQNEGKFCHYITVLKVLFIHYV